MSKRQLAGRTLTPSHHGPELGHPRAGTHMLTDTEGKDVLALCSSGQPREKDALMWQHWGSCLCTPGSQPLGLGWEVEEVPRTGGSSTFGDLAYPWEEDEQQVFLDPRGA